MSQGSRVSGSLLDTREVAGLQLQGSEQGLSTSYARLERGADRKISQNQVIHDMGTSQQLSTSLRKGELADLPLGRDALPARGTASRHASNSGSGSVPPVMTVSSNARTSSRPPSSALAHLLSPRQQHPASSTSSYRDAALLAAQHGLSAYAPSAAATANRTHTPRAGAKGRPPPAPRPMQHSAPAPNPYQSLGPEALPSCSGASPSPRRNSIAPSRGGTLFSRGSAPTPSSTHRSSDAAAAMAAVASHRSSDVATVTVTYNDALWRTPGLEQQPTADEGPPAASFLAPHVLGPTTGNMRVMSPGWGAAQPSVFEVDGRPGTRGGGPQYDIEGRPTTRSAQRPPSRAQLNMSVPLPRPPGHVAPLALGPGWAGLFAGGAGTGPGEASVSAPTPTSPRAPSAGAASTSWSGEATESTGAAGVHRRQPLPLPPAMSGAAVASASASAGAGGNATGTLAFSAPPGSSSGGGGAGGGGRGPGVLSAMAAGQPAGGHLGGLVSPLTAGQAATGQVGCVGGRPFSPKLSSIAEAPGSPAVSLKGGLLGRLDSITSRKSPHDPGSVSPGGPSVTAPIRDSPDENMSDEEGVNDDSYRSNLDQDSNRCGSGRTRPRSTPGLAQGTETQRHNSANGGHGQSSMTGSAGPSSPTHETPAIKPRR